MTGKVVSPAEAELGNLMAGQKAHCASMKGELCPREGAAKLAGNVPAALCLLCLRWELGVAPHVDNGLSPHARQRFATPVSKEDLSCLWVAFQLPDQSVNPSVSV